jgi:hypothetical protein
MILATVKRTNCYTTKLTLVFSVASACTSLEVSTDSLVCAPIMSFVSLKDINSLPVER